MIARLRRPETHIKQITLLAKREIACARVLTQRGDPSWTLLARIGRLDPRFDANLVGLAHRVAQTSRRLIRADRGFAANLKHARLTANGARIRDLQIKRLTRARDILDDIAVR